MTQRLYPWVDYWHGVYRNTSPNISTNLLMQEVTNGIRSTWGAKIEPLWYNRTPYRDTGDSIWPVHLANKIKRQYHELDAINNSKMQPTVCFAHVPPPSHPWPCPILWLATRGCHQSEDDSCGLLSAGRPTCYDRCWLPSIRFLVCQHWFRKSS